VFRSFHLSYRLHFPQDTEDFESDLPVAKQLNSFRANSVEQVAFLADISYIYAERIGQALLTNAALQGFQDHVVLHDRGRMVEPLIVGISLVVR
jgi:hypothetical protein